MLGLYIDTLPDAAKDRIICAQEWGGSRAIRTGWSVDVVDHAELRLAWVYRGALVQRLALGAERVMSFGFGARRRLRRRFLRLVERVGRGRAVRLVKLRAARRYMPQLPAGGVELS